MFLAGELKRLKNLVDETTCAEDVLDEKDITGLGKQIKVDRIRDRLFIPAHNRSSKTLLLIKVYKHDFDISTFVKQLLDCLIPEIELRIGLSFIMLRKDISSYVHPLPARIINRDNRLIRDHEDKSNLVTFLKGFSYSQLLNYTFNMRNTTNPFAESGYRPEKLVTATFWITKWASP